MITDQVHVIHHEPSENNHTSQSEVDSVPEFASWGTAWLKYSTLYGLQYRQLVAFKWFHEVKLLNLFNKNIGKSEFAFYPPQKSI